MKQLLKHSLTILLLFVLQYSFATTGTEGEKEAKSGAKQEQQQQQTDSKKPNNEVSEELSGGVSGEEEIIQDSVVDDSVSKYNFILYFLYKFKYEEEESI